MPITVEKISYLSNQHIRKWLSTIFEKSTSLFIGYMSAFGISHGCPSTEKWVCLQVFRKSFRSSFWPLLCRFYSSVSRIQ